MDVYISCFVETIKTYIAQKGLTVTAFARQLGVKDVCVARWIAGTNTPSIEYVILVADFLKCSVDYLLGIDENLDYFACKDKAAFSQSLKKLLVEKPISLNKLSKICGVTSSTVSKWLLHGQLPKPGVAIMLAAHFSCSLDYLLGRTNIK